MNLALLSKHLQRISQQEGVSKMELGFIAALLPPLVDDLDNFPLESLDVVCLTSSNAVFEAASVWEESRGVITGNFQFLAKSGDGRTIPIAERPDQTADKHAHPTDTFLPRDTFRFEKSGSLCITRGNKLDAPCLPIWVDHVTSGWKASEARSRVTMALESFEMDGMDEKQQLSVAQTFKDSVSLDFWIWKIGCRLAVLTIVQNIFAQALREGYQQALAVSREWLQASGSPIISGDTEAFRDHVCPGEGALLSEHRQCGGDLSRLLWAFSLYENGLKEAAEEFGKVVVPPHAKLSAQSANHSMSQASNDYVSFLTPFPPRLRMDSPFDDLRQTPPRHVGQISLQSFALRKAGALTTRIRPEAFSA